MQNIYKIVFKAVEQSKTRSMIQEIGDIKIHVYFRDFNIKFNKPVYRSNRRFKGDLQNPTGKLWLRDYYKIFEEMKSEGVIFGYEDNNIINDGVSQNLNHGMRVRITINPEEFSNKYSYFKDQKLIDKLIFVDNKLYLNEKLLKSTRGGENTWFAQYIIDNPGKITRDEMNQKINPKGLLRRSVDKDFFRILENLGITKEIKRAFFSEVKKDSLYFRNPIPKRYLKIKKAKST